MATRGMVGGSKAFAVDSAPGGDNGGCGAHPRVARPVIRRLAALLLLSSQVWTAAFAVSPLMEGRCTCTHAADAPCDCPHHRPTASADAPPCHRNAEEHSTPVGSSVRSHCASTQPVLMLPGWAAFVPGRILETAVVREHRHPAPVDAVPRFPPPPPRPPPKQLG